MVADTPVRNDAPRARAVRQLREWIAIGILPKGEPLPAERALARQLDVARPALRWAINVLTAEGLIHNQGVQTRMVALRTPMGEPAPDAAGSFLRHAVLVLAHTLEAVPGRRQGWTGTIVAGAVEAIRAAGYHAIALHPDRIDAQELKSLARGKPYGLIIPHPGPSLAAYGPILGDLAGAGITIVGYGAAAELARFDRVRSDHDAGAYAVTQWLIAQGHRRILQTGPSDMGLYWMKGRRSGYERAMIEAGLEPLPAVSLPEGGGRPLGRSRS